MNHWKDALPSPGLGAEGAPALSLKSCNTPAKRRKGDARVPAPREDARSFLVALCALALTSRVKPAALPCSQRARSTHFCSWRRSGGTVLAEESSLNSDSPEESPTGIASALRSSSSRRATAAPKTPDGRKRRKLGKLNQGGSRRLQLRARLPGQVGDAPLQDGRSPPRRLPTHMPAEPAWPSLRLDPLCCLQKLCSFRGCGAE